jgi:organic hydroperoxide reductase OsmC/OhrA
MADVFVSRLDWTGALQGATDDPETFSRNLSASLGSVTLPMSAAPAYHGNPARVNPEQLFVASLSACQALTYLFLAAKSGVAVVGYTDEAEGRLAPVDGKIRMSRVTLHPRITLEVRSDEARARELVARAHRGCFIANSVSTPVEIEPSFEFAEVPATV